MNKSIIILAKANKYMFQAEAILRDDMAKRIMYSVIPSLAKDSEVYHTGGVVDYKALAAAIEGRHDIIKYGAKACVQELHNYGGYGDQYNYDHILQLLKNADYKKIFEISFDLFSDSSNWNTSYGGEAWKKIAETLLKITQLDENLKQLRANKRSLPDFYDQEVEIMKQIVIYLNVFDGLSHNTNSILTNILEEEGEEIFGDYRKSTPFKEIEKLMDVKELKDPIDLFKQIYPTLKGSGDINRYKDWFNKIKLNEKYHQNNDDESSKELFIIRLRKTLNPYIITLNKDKEKLETSLNKIEVDNNSDLFDYEDIRIFTDSVDYITIIAGNVQLLFKNCFNKESQIEYQSIIDHIMKKLSLFNSEAKLLSNEFDNIIMNKDKIGKERFKNLIKKLNELVKNVLIYLEAI